MSTVWAQRREECWSDCIVSPDVCKQMVDRLGECVVPSQHALETEAGPHHMPLSLQGLLSHFQRQHAEDTATWVDVERPVIQDCIGPAPWDHRPLVTVWVGHGAERLGEPEGLIACDPRSFPKRGTHSVGVKRPWCGHRGQVDHCQVGICRGQVSRHDHAVLAFRLSLPEEWARDEPRRQECHVPEAVRYHPRQEQCVAMLEAQGDQVPHGWVPGDEERGRHPRFRRELRERGERDGLGVPCTTTMRDLAAPWPAQHGCGRRPKAPWPSVTEWRQSLPADAWTPWTVRDGEQGPVEIALATRRVQTRLERKRTGPEAWLVVTRRLLADDRPLEPRASRDATDQDARHLYELVASFVNCSNLLKSWEKTETCAVSASGVYGQKNVAITRIPPPYSATEYHHFSNCTALV